MKTHYQRAEAIARTGQHPELFYPALNRMAAELILDAGEAGWPGFDADAVAEARLSLAARTRDDPDFWSIVSLAELRVYEALARGDLARQRASIEAEYDDLHQRVSAAWMWGSVRDQARWVLLKYAERASTKEQAAARGLLKFLEALARP
jgi:hypothetical protein